MSHSNENHTSPDNQDKQDDLNKSGHQLPKAIQSPVGNWADGFALDLHLREFEISQLTQRNNFFMIFQGVLISGLLVSEGNALPLINFSVSLLGVMVSLFQVGMAGGAKYWQSRWESATRSSEVNLTMTLVKEGLPAIRTFTHDFSSLTDEERAQFGEWNSQKPDDQILHKSNEIQKRVQEDIASRGNLYTIRGCLDWWVRKLAIEPRWSVSRIPIWVGAALMIFWLFVWLHTWSLENFDLFRLFSNLIVLTPLSS